MQWSGTQTENGFNLLNSSIPFVSKKVREALPHLVLMSLLQRSTLWKKGFKCHCAVIIYSNASASVDQIGMICWFSSGEKSLQVLILHLITKASVHFFSLIRTPCLGLLDRIYYTALINMEFWGLTGVTGQTRLIVWLFTLPITQLCMKVLASLQTETDEFLTSLRQMVPSLPAAITERAMNPISHITFLSSSMGA